MFSLPLGVPWLVVYSIVIDPRGTMMSKPRPIENGELSKVPGLGMVSPSPTHQPRVLPWESTKSRQV